MTIEEFIESMKAFEELLASISKASYMSFETISHNYSYDISSFNREKPTYFGTNGNDIRYGRSFDEVYFAKAGDDFITDGGGADEMYGEAGSDEFLVTRDYYKDYFIGGSGTDFFYAQMGGDSFYGGEIDGTDTEFDLIDYRYYSKAIKVELAKGLVTSRDKAAYDRIEGIEGARGSKFADRLYGDGKDNELYGDAGDDRLYGYGGDDYLSGGVGNDVISGGANNDALHGQGGNDTIHDGSGDDYINGGRGNDTIYFGSGNDTFVFSKGDGRDTLMNLNLDGGDVIRLQGFGDEIDHLNDVMIRAKEFQHDDLGFWTEIYLPGRDHLTLDFFKMSDFAGVTFEFV